MVCLFLESLLLLHVQGPVYEPTSISLNAYSTVYCCYVFLKEILRRDGKVSTSLFIFCSEWYQLKNNNIYTSQHYPLSFSAYLVGLKIIIISNFNLWTIKLAHFKYSVLNFDKCILPYRYHYNQDRDYLPHARKIFVPLPSQFPFLTTSNQMLIMIFITVD